MTEAHCEFCNSTYEFTQEEITKLLEEKKHQELLNAATAHVAD